MNDLPDREPPRFWVAVSIFVVALALTVFMLVYTTVRAEAQEPICAPVAEVAAAWEEYRKESIAWEGVLPLPEGPPAEMILFQSDKGAWSLFVVQGGIACLRAAGQNGTPINDKGV